MRRWLSPARPPAQTRRRRLGGQRLQCGGRRVAVGHAFEQPSREDGAGHRRHAQQLGCELDGELERDLAPTFDGRGKDCTVRDVDGAGARQVDDDAARSAGWFWKSRGLNDATDYATITKKINGGVNGQEHRLALYAKAKAALGV